MKSNFLEMELETQIDSGDSASSFLSEIDAGRSHSRRVILPQGRNDSFLASFLFEMIPAIKSNLGFIRNFALIPADKFNDFELIRSSQRSVNDNIKEIDSVLNTLLNFININTPIVKGDTVYSILKEVLEANERQIQSKGLKISKKGEANLPETLIYDEQVKFILNSTLQYAILSTPIGGSISFMLRTSGSQEVAIDKMALSENNGGCIEVRVAFSNTHQMTAQEKYSSDISSSQKEKTGNLLLYLVREILEKNRGMMTREVDKESLRTTITLRFPMERRKVVYYEPIAL